MGGRRRALASAEQVLDVGANEQCALTTGDNRWEAGLDVVVEGRAEQVTDDALLRALVEMCSLGQPGRRG